MDLKSIFSEYGSQVRIHTVESQVTSANVSSGKIFFPDDSILRNRQIVGVAVVPPQSDDTGAADLTLNSPLTDRPLINRDAFNNTYVTIMNNNIQVLESAPLRLFGIFDGDKGIQQVFTTSWTPEQSFFQVSNPGAAGRLTAGESILLHFAYLD